MQEKIRLCIAGAVLSMVSFQASAQLFDNVAEKNHTKPAANILASKPARSSDAGKADDTAATLNNYINQTQTLAGKFDQIVYSDRGEAVSSGTFRLKRPGMFDWNYAKPSEQRIISNGNKVYHYDKDLAQITVRPRNELAGDVAMKLLVGEKRLDQAFSVSRSSPDKVPARLRSDSKGLTYYQLKPKQQKDQVDQVWVAMYQGAVVAVYVDTGVGQQSLIVLKNLQRNQPMSAQSFQFTPPAGVDVIGD